MPWEVVKEEDGWFVVKEGTRTKVHKSPYKSRAEAMAHVRALYSAEDIDTADVAVKKNAARKGEPTPSPAKYRG
jgi:hypothetical protein